MLLEYCLQKGRHLPRIIKVIHNSIYNVILINQPFNILTDFCPKKEKQSSHLNSPLLFPITKEELPHTGKLMELT